MKILLTILLAFPLMIQQESFKETQRKQAHVKTAFSEMESVVKKYFSDKKLSYDKFQMFIRAFKHEQKLEVWVKENGKQEFVLLQVYDFCTTSGTLGPKRREGDRQIPEGAYYINHFNPLSNFYLSLGLNYPNDSDKILSHKTKPGGNIYIHGGCATIGCIPITDDKIKEVYLMAVEARNNGQDKIPVHVFPMRLDNGAIEKILTEYTFDEKSQNFWKNLTGIYNDFESTKKLRRAKVNGKGEYYY